MKQGMNEPIKSYYKRMADISIKLEQYHGDCFGPGELSLMKDCFYAEPKEHKYLVSHIKDRDQYGPAQMLKEIWEQDSRYPVNTTLKPHSKDNRNKNMTHYGGKSSPYEKTQTYAVSHTDVQLPDLEPDEPDPPLNCQFDAGEVYDEGYYVAIIAMADEVDQWGRCVT